jgi:putative transposase
VDRSSFQYRREADGDAASRECLAAVVDTSLSGARVVREFNEVIARRGRPRMIVSDNGTELVSRAILSFCEPAIEWHYIAPGKPILNAFAESFNGRLRDCRFRGLEAMPAHWNPQRPARVCFA